LVFATVVLKDEIGNILLQQRTDFNHWGLPGGALELDEDVNACARRELEEETGLTAGKLRLVGLYTDPHYDVVYPNGDYVQQYTICFAGRRHGGEMRPDGIETSDQAFLSLEQMESMNIPIWYRDMIRDALKDGPPAFRAPYAVKYPIDQFSDVRPLIGNSRYIGVGAAAAVLQEDGRLLAVQRRDSENWELPAGFSDLGENAAHTVQRITLEETGLKIMPETILAIYSSSDFNITFANGDEVKNVGTLFRARVVEGQLKADGREILQAAWLSPAEFLSRASDRYHPFFRLVFSRLSSGYVVS